MALRAVLPEADIDARVSAVRGPRPVLPRARERRLTERQREVLDGLSTMFDEGFADLDNDKSKGQDKN